MLLLYVQLLGAEVRYRILCAVMINPLELSINDEASNNAHITSTGVRRYLRRVFTSKNETQGSHIKKRNGKLAMHQKIS